jgi:hypothetical protein
MKTSIPLSVSHPHLHAARQQHLKPYNDAAGLVLAMLVGVPLLTALIALPVIILFSL